MCEEYCSDQEESADEETEPTFSEDEAVSQRGLRRSQSVKMTRSRVRKDVSALFQIAGVCVICFDQRSSQV